MQDVVWGSEGQWNFIPAHEEPELLMRELDLMRRAVWIQRYWVTLQGSILNSANTRDKWQVPSQKGFSIPVTEGSWGCVDMSARVPFIWGGAGHQLGVGYSTSVDSEIVSAWGVWAVMNRTKEWHFGKWDVPPTQTINQWMQLQRMGTSPRGEKRAEWTHFLSGVYLHTMALLWTSIILSAW